MRCLLDTCTWIWATSDRRRISPAAAQAILEASETATLHLSVISCWEVAKLVQKGRLGFGMPVGDWIRRALGREGLALVEFTPRICVESTELPGSFHGDPADQILVATARSLDLELLTPDRAIRDYPAVRSRW